MESPYGAPGGSALPPSRFGAGYTIGDGVTPPTVDAHPYPPQGLEPPAPIAYPQVPVHYPVTVVPGGYVPAARTNSMAIVALVCSLVLAPLGVVFGHIALSQIKRSGEDGRGLAIAGLVIGYVFTAVAVASFIFLVVVANAFRSAVEQTPHYDGGYTYSMSEMAPVIGTPGCDGEAGVDASA